MASEAVRAFLGGYTEYFAVFGGVAASYLAWKICLEVLRVLRTYLIAKSIGAGGYLRSKGQWAVVTGATDGIGKEYVRQLAGYGINIVLISRTESKLRDVANEIESRYKVKTQIIAADYTQGTTIYENIRKRLTGLDVGVLVNNVGMSYEYPEYFLDIPDREKTCMNLIHVNCTSVTMMTSIVMEGMVQRKKGVVINIASSAGNQATPLLSVYSACKVYVRYLSECLDYEYAKKGITVQCVNPYFVCSNMSKIKRPSLFIPSAEAYVKSALSTVGADQTTYGYFPHYLLGLISSLVPRAVTLSIGTKTFQGARARALKKRDPKKSS